MPDDWVSYFCKVNDKLASIFVNLGLRQNVPDRARPHLLYVWIYFKQPRPDGLSSQEEFQTLRSLEDSLLVAVEQKCGGIMPGRITTSGRREFYFYAPEASTFQAALDEGLASYSNYRYWSGHKDDPDWSQYLQVLFPNPMQRQKIENRKVLDVLEGHGDSLLAERDVMHWAYFKNTDDRESFKQAALRLGYSIDEESISERDRSYSLRFKKKQSVTPDEIDHSVLELFQLAEGFNGKYDGWESEVISDGSGPVH
jgi:uncharacterized protein (TIGR01619 family)